MLLLFVQTSQSSTTFKKSVDNREQICYILIDRSYECICDVESSRGIPIPECDRPYIQQCVLICKMAAQLRNIFVDVHVVGAPCPFDDSREG